MIELDKVTCNYDNKTVLNDISLSLDAHATILGANGSGKSTLAKSICDLTNFSGSIKINSQDIKKLSPIQRAKNISYIPAKLEFYDSFITVEEFVLLGRFAYKKSFFEYSLEDKKIAKKSLESLNISHLKEHSIGSLSSGESQLALIAQALTTQSKIIIFDEPTANLDPHNSKVIAQHIKELKQKHQIILITHDLTLASYIDSAIVFIKDTRATKYKNDFFSDSNLENLYGVKFNSLAVKYD